MTSPSAWVSSPIHGSPLCSGRTRTAPSSRCGRIHAPWGSAVALLSRVFREGAEAGDSQHWAAASSASAARAHAAPGSGARGAGLRRRQTQGRRGRTRFREARMQRRGRRSPRRLGRRRRRRGHWSGKERGDKIGRQRGSRIGVEAASALNRRDRRQTESAGLHKCETSLQPAKREELT